MRGRTGDGAGSDRIRIEKFEKILRVDRYGMEGVCIPFFSFGHFSGYPSHCQ